MDVLDKSYTKKLFKGLSSGYLSSTVTDNADGSKTLTINFVNGDKADITFNSVKGDKGDTGASVQDIKIKEISGARHLIVTLDDGTEIDAGTLPNEQYDDTQIKSDIKTLQDTKQNSTDTNLNTTEKTVTGSINEIYGNSLDVVGFSSDYKNIILNRRNGLNPVTIPLVSIISHSKLQELFDVDITDIGNGKTLVYDAVTGKHKYVSSTGTDELVKMEAGGNACYLSDLLDGITLVNDGGFVKAKKLDGQEVTITEINYLKGLTMNVMELVNMFSNGGVKIINTPVQTYSELLAYDKSSLIDGISYLVYVLTDETHDNAKTTYLIDKTSSVPTYFGFAGEHRDFTTSPINLANEVTGKLGTSNIDVDSLFALLSIDDTYKTLTDVNKVFGTHGANAMYTELVEGIGKKANDTDLTAHTDNTDIHITPEEKKEFKNKVDKGTVINTNPTSSGAVSQFMVWEDSSGNNFGGMNFVTGDGIGRQFRMSDYEDHMSFIKSNGGTGVEERYKILDERDITNTIDGTSADTQAPSAKAVYNKILDSKEVITKLFVDENGGDFIECLKSLELDENKIYSLGFKKLYTSLPYKAWWEVLITGCFREKMCIARNTWNDDYYIADLIKDGEWSIRGSWKKICTTSVRDVPKTLITISDETNYKNSATCESFYIVKNGTCFVTLALDCVSPLSNVVIGNLPPAYGVIRFSMVCKDGVMDGYILPSGELKVSSGTANTKYYVVSFSYPVSES